MEDAEQLGLECSVCFDIKTIDSITFLPCIHFLCSACYNKLKKNECPFCRNQLREEQKEDSYSETENEYHDVHFEMLVIEENKSRRRDKKSKKKEQRIMKLLKDNKEVVVSINRNTYIILDSFEN
jgi:hypothetical protein